jgi:hypothetical protein
LNHSCEMDGFWPVKEFRSMGGISRNFRCRWRIYCIESPSENATDT